MATFTVQKLNTRGELVTSYTAQLVRWLPGGVLVDARWTRPPLALGYATFETGDHFREAFYTDHWYSIFEIRSAGDALKGWYCNAAEPATIRGAIIASRDLILDLWVAPDGTTTALDEDELAADTTLDAAAREKARWALGELERLVREHAPPFDQAFSAR